MIVSRAGDWISAKAGDEIVMMSVEAGKYLGLNPVGARIWELIETPLSVEALTAQPVSEFDIEEAACRTEVDTFLESLAKQRAIATSTAPE